jgi:hypothetical protein
MEYFELTAYESTEVADTGTMDIDMPHTTVTAVTDMADEIDVKALASVEAKATKAAKQAVDKAAKAAARVEAERTRIATLQRIGSLLSAGEALAKQHDGYETQYVTNANADLYVLLARIHAYAEEVQANSDVDAVVKQMREELLKKHKIKTQKNSPQLNIIVRFITRTNRKNASVYARVIRKAIADGITSNDLVAYIVNAEGIDKIREAVIKKPIEITDVKKAETFWKYAASYLEAQIIKPMASFELGTEHSSYMVDTVRGGRFTYFVCDYVDGKYQVVDALMMDKALEQQLLERVYSNATNNKTRTKEEVALLNKIEAELGLTRKAPLVANAYEPE